MMEIKEIMAKVRRLIKGRVKLSLDNFKDEGLYLILPDSSRIILTNDNIGKVTNKYWDDPEKIPSKVKAAVEFQRCSFCPLKEKKDFCDALRPILPFLDAMDKYASFDEVTAVYRDDSKNLYYMADTTMQQALKFISTMSLMRYCHIGRKYWKYYLGVEPLTGAQEMAKTMYLNMFWLNNGDAETVKKIIATFCEQIRITSSNQVKRLNLICKSDAFINSFVNTQVATMFLSMDIKNVLAKAFEEFDERTT